MTRPLLIAVIGKSAKDPRDSLVKHGYGDADVRKNAGGNALRVLRETWAC